MPNPENIIPPKPGEVRNPNGKPKGTKNRSTIARKWLEVMQDTKNPITGELEKLSQEDLITLAMIHKARKGDVGAYKQLMDSGFGMPTQQIDVTTEKPIFNGINLDVTNNDRTEENSTITKTD
jgi:hypothetical protein